MLFQVSFDKTSGKLWGVIGNKGNLYWGAVSVARYLNYRSPYHFARNHSTTKVNDVTSEYWTRGLEKSLLKLQLFTHNHALYVFERCKSKRAQVAFKNLSGKEFYVRVKKTFQFPIAQHCSRRDWDAVEFYQWIDAYRRALNAEEEGAASEEAAAEVARHLNEEDDKDEEEPGYSKETPTYHVSPPIRISPVTAANPDSVIAHAKSAAVAIEPVSMDTFATESLSGEYTPTSPPYPPPPSPVPDPRGGGSQFSNLSTCVHLKVSANSAFEPYTPADPPYNFTEGEEEDDDDDAAAAAAAPPPPPPPPPPPTKRPEPLNALPPKKRFRLVNDNTSEEGVMIWLSGFPPKKLIVLHGSSAQEFLPKD